MLKIVFIGDEAVGKTSIINNCINSSYNIEYTPTEETKLFDQNYPNKSCSCQIWDTPGQSQFISQIPPYLKSCNTCLILYDITCRQSFLNLDKWFNFISENTVNNPVIFIIGNKKDLEDKRQISSDEAETYAKSHNVQFLETSVKEDSDFIEKIIDISLPIVQNTPEYIKAILRESKKSLETSKNELKKIKKSLKETRGQPGANIESITSVINMLTDTKNSLEERKISLEKSEKPSKEGIQSLAKSINSIQVTINSLQISKTSLQKTIQEEKAEISQAEKELSQEEKELSKVERKLSQKERKLTQDDKEIEEEEEELIEKVEEQHEEESVHEEEEELDQQEEEEIEQEVNDLVQEEKELEKELKELDEIEFSLAEDELDQDDEKKSSYEDKKQLEEKIELYSRTIKILKATKDSSREMSALLISLRKKLKEKKEKHLDYLPQIRCLMLGLDLAGKTTILYRLKRNKFVNTNPTTGFNCEPVLNKEVIFNLWDIGGKNHLRSSWKYYYENSRVLIFVVDSSDLQRFDEAKKELNRLLKENELEDCPLLVFANKQDLPNSIKTDELAYLLELNKISDRKWHILGTNAVSGEGLLQGLDWIGELFDLWPQKNDPEEPKPKINNKLPRVIINKLKEIVCSLEDKDNSSEDKLKIVRRFVLSLEHYNKSLSSTQSTSLKRNNYTENIDVLIRFFKKIHFVLQSKISNS